MEEYVSPRSGVRQRHFIVSGPLSKERGGGVGGVGLVMGPCWWTRKLPFSGKLNLLVSSHQIDQEFK